MSAKGRRKSVAQKIQSPRNSKNDELLESSQDSQNKSRSKNYSAEESAALIRCSEKFHAIISKNSSRDKDKNEKQQAWEKIKSEFDQYCKSEGIYVS